MPVNHGGPFALIWIALILGGGVAVVMFLLATIAKVWVG